MQFEVNQARFIFNQTRPFTQTDIIRLEVLQIG